MRNDRHIDLRALLADLAQSPRFDGARCRAHPEAFDVVDGRRQRAAVAAAVAECQRCPALEACAQWLAGLRPCERPSGIVAGRLVRPAPPRGGGGIDPTGIDPGGIARRGYSTGGIRVVRHRAAPRRDAAAEWLRAALAAAGGSAVSNAVQAAALAVGFDRQLLFQARRRLGVTSRRGVGGIGGNHTLWALP